MIRQLAAIVLLAFAPWLPARAPTDSADYSDLWLNASESGWGLDVIQQRETLFLTLFVYGTSTNAGVFSLSELDAQRNGFHATFSGRDQYGTYNGRFGGTRDPGG